MLQEGFRHAARALVPSAPSQGKAEAEGRGILQACGGGEELPGTGKWVTGRMG